MTHKPEHDADAGLEVFFSAARAEVPTPSANLLVRIESGALDTLPGPAQAERGSFLGGLIAALGGWPAMAGLASAACAGVWLGFSPPDAMLAIWQGDTASYDVIEALDPVSGYDFAMTEG